METSGDVFCLVVAAGVVAVGPQRQRDKYVNFGDGEGAAHELPKCYREVRSVSKLN
jgi:hypothetical protein